jgi:hypothetical protein
MIVDNDSIFALADSLEPGTYVPIIKYEQSHYGSFYDNNETEEKIREIKQRLRAKIGDYGTADGITIRDRA